MGAVYTRTSHGHPLREDDPRPRQGPAGHPLRTVRGSHGRRYGCGQSWDCPHPGIQLSVNTARRYAAWRRRCVSVIAATLTMLISETTTMYPATGTDDLVEL
jgi:hypothetical protein